MHTEVDKVSFTEGGVFVFNASNLEAFNVVCLIKSYRVGEANKFITSYLLQWTKFQYGTDIF